MAATPLNRLDKITLAAFRADLCSFEEAIVINLCAHMIGTLEPIGHMEEARQRMIANYDGTKPDDAKFLDTYDWEYVRCSLQQIADSICKVGSDRDTSMVAQELETLARWIRLTK